MLLSQRSSSPVPPASPPLLSPTPRYGILSVYLLLLLVQLLWSAYHVFAKYAISFINPYVLPGVRCLVASPCLYLLCRYQHGPDSFNLKSKSDRSLLLLMCFAGGTCALQLFNMGLSLSTAIDAGISQPTIPIFTTLIALALKRETMSWMKAIGICSSVGGSIGVVIGETLINGDTGTATASGSTAGVSSNSVSSSSHAVGMIVFMCQCLLFACYVTIQKQFISRYPPLVLTCYLFTVGGIPNIVVALIAAGYTDWSLVPPIAYAILAYTGLIATVVCYSLFAYACQYLPASTTSLVICLAPLTTATLSWLFLGETLLWVHVVGAVAIVSGLYTVVKSRQMELKADNEKAKESERMKEEAEAEARTEGETVKEMVEGVKEEINEKLEGWNNEKIQHEEVEKLEIDVLGEPRVEAQGEEHKEQETENRIEQTEMETSEEVSEH